MPALGEVDEVEENSTSDGDEIVALRTGAMGVLDDDPGIIGSVFDVTPNSIGDAEVNEKGR